LLLGRLYVIKFLDDNSQASVDRVKLEFEELNKQLKNLDRNLQNRRRRELFKEVETKQEVYFNAFQRLTKVIFNRNEIIENSLDKIGPEIAGLINEIKLSIKDQQDTLGPKLQAANSSGLTFIIIVSILAAGACIIFGVFISNMISKPIKLVSERVEQLRLVCITNLG